MVRRVTSHLPSGPAHHSQTASRQCCMMQIKDNCAVDRQQADCCNEQETLLPKPLQDNMSTLVLLW